MVSWAGLAALTSWGCSLRGLDYLVRLSHERQYVVCQLYARCVYEAAARGLDCYGSEGHRILAGDTECFRHQDIDADRAGIGVRPEDDGQQRPQGTVQAGDLVAGENVVTFWALIFEASFSSRASRDRAWRSPSGRSSWSGLLQR